MRLRTYLLIEKEVDSDLIYANVQIEIWKSCGIKKFLSLLLPNDIIVPGRKKKCGYKLI